LFEGLYFVHSERPLEPYTSTKYGGIPSQIFDYSTREICGFGLSTLGGQLDAPFSSMIDVELPVP